MASYINFMLLIPGLSPRKKILMTSFLMWFFYFLNKFTFLSYGAVADEATSRYYSTRWCCWWTKTPLYCSIALWNFWKFVSQNYWRQISTLSINEEQFRKNNGGFVTTTFKIAIMKFPLSFLIFDLLKPRIEICPT